MADIPFELKTLSLNRECDVKAPHNFNYISKYQKWFTIKTGLTQAIFCIPKWEGDNNLFLKHMMNISDIQKIIITIFEVLENKENLDFLIDHQNSEWIINETFHINLYFCNDDKIIIDTRYTKQVELEVIQLNNKIIDEIYEKLGISQFF